MGEFPEASEFARFWRLDPSVVMLNHGSFGACPSAVLEAQSRVRDRMEAEPVRFFVEELEGLLDEARAALGRFVGAAPEGLAMVSNATIAVSTVLENTALGPGDEVLINDHEYPACVNAFAHAAAKRGASVRRVELPFPVRDPERVVEAILGGVTDRTRLVLISHVTSPSGMVLPIERIVPMLEARGVACLVDGAHAPGFIPLEVDRLGASYYTGNCHKWICAPKGAAFLHVREDRRAGFRPLALSVSAEREREDRSKFLVEFDYVGSQDYSASIVVGEAIRVVGGMLDGGWAAVRDRNRSVALRGRDVLCERLGVEPCVPDSMLGSMATVRLPPVHERTRQRLSARPTKYHDALQDALIRNHLIQVPITSVGAGGHRCVRISMHLYNSEAQVRYLADALAVELERERAEAG